MIFRRLGRKSGLTKPGARWFNAVSNFIEGLSIRYGTYLGIERDSDDCKAVTIVVPHPAKMLSEETVYVVRKATQDDVDAEIATVVGEPMLSERRIYCGPEVSAESMVPHQCPETYE